MNKKKYRSRLYCDKKFRELLKKKALENGYEEYPKFTSALAENPDLWNIDLEKKNKKKRGEYGLF